MDENPITIDDFQGKGDVALFGDPAAATEHLRDYLASLFSPLGCHLGLIDDLADHDDAARTTAMVGAALLRQANGILDQLHEQLRQAGFGILVEVEGKSWEPRGVTACTVKRLPAPDSSKMEADNRAEEFSQAWSVGMGILRDHPGLAEEMLDHLGELVAKAQEANHA